MLFCDNEVLLVSDVRLAPVKNILAEMPTKQYAAVITLPTHLKPIFSHNPEIRVDLNMVKHREMPIQRVKHSVRFNDA
jgi:ABC-2 type transport system permease protein